MISACDHLFVAKGYTATTMSDIAKEAGVAMQSVYKAGRSKADLLQRVIDVVVAGDDAEVLMTERPSFTAIAAGAERTPTGRDARSADRLHAGTISSRAGCLSRGAAVDEAVAANLDAELQRRHETFSTVIGMIPAAALRQSRRDSTDTAWAIGSSEVYLLLRVRRGWSAAKYKAWLARTLTEQLITVSNAP